MRLNSIEAGRGLAAFAVVLFHMNASAAWHDGFATLPLLGVAIHGVDFFFVLSGFIIFHVHRGDIGRPERAWDFAAKRFIRLFPVLWLVVLGTIAVYLLGHRPVSGEQAMTSLLLVPSLAKPVPDTVWTLRHELMFYLAFLVLIANRRAGVLLFAGWTLAVLVQLGLALAGRPVTGLAAFFLSTYELDFLLGAATALMAGRVRPGWGLFVLSVLQMGMVLWLGEHWAMSRVTLADYTSVAATGWVLVLGVSFALLVLGMLAIEAKVVVPSWLVALGGCSYALYLIHVPVQLVLMWAGWNLGLPGWAVLLLLAIVPVPLALAVHHHFERPVSRWLRSRLLRQGGGRVAGA